MVTKEQIEKCTSIAKHYGANRLVLFGSAANDPDHARDIDLICDGVNGYDIIRMGAEMEDATMALIDLIPAQPVTLFVEFNLSRGKVLYEI